MSGSVGPEVGSDLLLSEYLQEPSILFVLWSIKWGVCKSLEDFRHNFGADFPIESLVDNLVAHRLVHLDGAELALSEHADLKITSLLMKGTPAGTSAELEHNVTGLSTSLVGHHIRDTEYNSFMAFMGKSVQFVGREELSGGFSGARTASIAIVSKAARRQRALSGHYILKVCRTLDGEAEVAKHKEVRKDRLIRHHMPQIANVQHDRQDDLVGILYTVAEGSLLKTTTLQRSFDEKRYPSAHIGALALTILRWNLNSIGVFGTVGLNQLIPHIKASLEIDGLNNLTTQLQRIVANCDSPFVTSPFGQRHVANPIPYLSGKFAFMPRGVDPICLGRLHGDLHLGNVVISEQGDPNSFTIIDFAQSRVGNALFDLAYLELSILLSAFDGFATQEMRRAWWELENRYLRTEMMPQLEQFEYQVGGNLAMPIRRALLHQATTDNFHDAYWMSFLAASIEASLYFVRILDKHPRLQCAAFLTAASRFDELVNLSGATPNFQRTGGGDSFGSVRWQLGGLEFRRGGGMSGTDLEAARSSVQTPKSSPWLVQRKRSNIRRSEATEERR